MSPHVRPRLTPHRALLHPLWLGALATLALNDHILKGAGIVPGAVTGKLSDFAGLLVAPLLLASLLRVRGRLGWIAAHVAVAVVFSAIQLSAWAASTWSDAMALVGFPWVITRDPTDLVALAALVASAWSFPSAMRQRPRTHARRGAELAAAGTGLLLCAATSPPTPPLVVPDLFTDVWLHNGSDAPLIVRVRGIAPTVDFDCETIEQDAGRLLTEPLFGDVSAWTLEPDRNLSLRDAFAFDEVLGARECIAVLLDADGVLPVILLWRDGEIPTRSVPGEGWDEEIEGGILLEQEEDGALRFVPDDAGIVRTVRPSGPPLPGACAPQDEGARLAWSDLPQGRWMLTGVDAGADGCLAVDLAPSLGGSGAAQRWYLCVPGEVFPFEAEREIAIDPLHVGDATGVRVADDAGSELWLYTGDLVPATSGLTFATVPTYACELRPDECGTVARSAVIAAGGGSWDAIEITAGEAPRTIEHDDGTRATIYVAHAQTRVALDPECAAGPDTLGDDLEVAVAIVAAQ